MFKFSCLPNVIIPLLLFAGLIGCSGDNREQAGSGEPERGPAEHVEASEQTGLPVPAPAPAPQKSAERELSAQQRAELQGQAWEILNSIQMVVDGYYSMLHRWPENSTDFDSSGYMFDSAYMAGVVSEGFTLYLAPGPPAVCRIWLLAQNANIGYRLDDKKRALVEVDMQQALDEIGSGYRVESNYERLVFLDRNAE